MGCRKSSARGKFIAIQSYLKKQGKHRIKNQTLNRKQLEKEGQNKTKQNKNKKNTKISRRKEIIKIHAEINERNNSKD